MSPQAPAAAAAPPKFKRSAKNYLLDKSFQLKYAGYIERQTASIARQQRQETRVIPRGFSFTGIPGLSREMVERLTTIQPETLGQAARIPGVTPAAVAVLAVYLDRPRSPAAL